MCSVGRKANEEFVQLKKSKKVLEKLGATGALTGLYTILHDEVTGLKSIHAGHRTNKDLLCAVRKKLQEPHNISE